MLRLYTGPHLGGRAYHARGASRSARTGQIWLARTGGLPGRSLAGYRRWALTPPFHPSPVPSIRPSAGLLSLALDVAVGLRLGAPRVIGPSGLCDESGLCSTSRITPGNSDGSDGPDSVPDYTAVGQTLDAIRRARALPRLRRTILVGVRRSSTLSVPLHRFCQRGSSPTAGSNQTPGPSSSRTPS